MHLLSLYGLPRVSIDHAAPLTLSAREAALLAWLHLEGPTPRAVIAGRLWSHGDESKARANLRQTLARLKRAAGEVIAETDGVLALAPGVKVATDGDARLLGPIEFDDAPELAEWLAARREAQQRDLQREHSAAAREHLARGDLDAALAAADALLTRDPAIEEAHRLRMEVHYLRGDRAAAIAAWDECKLALRAAFGIAPSAPTQELGALILASAATPTAAYASRTLPAALRRPPHLVGRESVLHDIERSFALGHGVVVAGVGGIGKSRLMAEAAARLQPAISIAARPGDAVLPGAVASRLVAAAIERFAPELDAATRADIARLMPSAEGSTQALRSALEHRRVLASVARTMLACHAKGMLLVVVDDLQFADDESMAAIQIVVGGWLADPPASAALPMFGARPAELRPAAAALVSMMDGSTRSTRFDLAPLAAPDVRRLLDDLPLDGEVDRDALAAALHAQVGGNPAYLLESLKALWLDGLDRWRAGQSLPLPTTLVESVRQRLARLPEDALHLAQLAAVARTDFSSALAVAAFGRSPMQLAPLWAALESAQVFDGLGFGHDLMAEAVERSLGASLRSALHRLVAEHLVASGAAPACVAHHWHGAGDRRAAATWRLRSARQARSRWQMPEAAHDFERAALALDAEDERASACAAWRDAARCWSRCDEDARAAAALDAADALARTTRERLVLGAARIAQQINARELDAAVRSAARLIDDLPAARAHLDATELAEAARFACATVPYGLPLHGALALCDAAQQALAGDDGGGLVELRAARGGALHWAAQLREAEAELAAAWGAHAADAAQKIGLGNRLARVRHSLGDIDGALEVGEPTLALAERMGAGPGTVVDLIKVLAMMQLGKGRPAAALARLDDALTRARQAGADITDAMACDLALAFVAVGHLDEAERWLGCYPAPGRAGFALHDLMYFTAQARLAVARGASPQGALRGLDTLLRTSLPQGPLLQGRATLLQWQPIPAGDVQALLAELRERGMKTLLRCALGGAARAALGDGRRDDAIAHVHEALAFGAQCDIWCEEPAQLWCTAHEVLSRCGLHDEASAARSTGADWVQTTAQQWPEGPQRQAWLRANPLHRALIGAGEMRRSG